MKHPSCPSQQSSQTQTPPIFATGMMDDLSDNKEKNHQESSGRRRRNPKLMPFAREKKSIRESRRILKKHGSCSTAQVHFKFSYLISKLGWFGSKITDFFIFWNLLWQKKPANFFWKIRFQLGLFNRRFFFWRIRANLENSFLHKNGGFLSLSTITVISVKSISQSSGVKISKKKMYKNKNFYLFYRNSNI